MFQQRGNQMKLKSGKVLMTKSKIENHGKIEVQGYGDVLDIEYDKGTLRQILTQYENRIKVLEQGIANANSKLIQIDAQLIQQEEKNQLLIEAIIALNEKLESDIL